MESPLRTEHVVDSCSVKHQGNCCASTPEIPATWLSIRTQGTDVHATRPLRSHATSTLGSLSVRKETCSIEKTAAFSGREHTWISLRAQRDVFHRKDCCVLRPRAHLDLAPCANRHVHATTLLHSHAVSTLGSLSVRKKTCSGEKTAAFARREHSWISLRAQEDLFMRQIVLRSHAVSTLGSRSVRKETCSIEKTAVISRCLLKIDDFYLRTPDPVSTVKRAHVPCAIGNP